MSEFKADIAKMKARIAELEELMEDAPNDAGAVNDNLYYANELADAKARLTNLEHKALIYLSDYVKKCPVVGTYVLTEPKKVTRHFEQAAWYEDIELFAGVYEVRADLRAFGDRKEITQLFVPMSGTILKANFPAVCGGMQYKNNNDAKETGKGTYYTLSTGMKVAIDDPAFSFSVKHEIEGPFVFLVPQRYWFCYAVDFGNAGSKLFKVIAETKEEARALVWGSLSDEQEDGLDQNYVESMEMLEKMVTEDKPERLDSKRVTRTSYDELKTWVSAE